MKLITRRRAIGLCVSAMLVLSLAGCASQGAGSASGDASAPASASGPVMVKDMKGADILAEGEAKNIVTANSVATQMVLMLGGEDAAATLGAGFNNAQGSLNANMFPGLGDKRTVTRDDCTVENIAAIDPSMVVIDNDDIVKSLRDSDIPAAFASVGSPETIKQALQIIGDCLGGDAAAKAADYGTYYDAILAKATDKASKIADADKPRALYLRSETRACGEKSMPDSWITAAGGRNVGIEMGLSGAGGGEVTAEAILEADPDIIICEKADCADALKSDAKYSELKAVKSGAVYQAPVATAVWSMGTAEAPLMVCWAAKTINPAAFADMDIEAETLSFFKTFYGYELSGAELDAIFHR